MVLNDRMNLSQSGTLTISELSKETDAGLYTCVASTKSGKSTWSAYLKLEAPTNPNIRFYRAPEASTFPGQPGTFLNHISFVVFIRLMLLCLWLHCPFSCIMFSFQLKLTKWVKFIVALKWHKKKFGLFWCNHCQKVKLSTHIAFTMSVFCDFTLLIRRS